MLKSQLALPNLSLEGVSGHVLFSLEGTYGGDTHMLVRVSVLMSPGFRGLDLVFLPSSPQLAIHDPTLVSTRGLGLLDLIWLRLAHKIYRNPQ